MAKLNIRGAELRSALLTQKEAVVSHRLKIACAPSPALMEHMQWEEFPEYIPGSKLEGEILAKNFVLTPDNKELQKFELQLSCDSVDDFEWSRKQDGDATRVEIRFYIMSSQDGAAALVENYKRMCGASLGSLRMNAEEQVVMDLAPAAEEDLKNPKPEVLELQDETGAPVRRFDSQEDAEAAGVAGEVFTLPTAHEAAGRTPHLRGKKQEKPAELRRARHGVQ